MSTISSERSCELVVTKVAIAVSSLRQFLINKKEIGITNNRPNPTSG